MKKSFYIASFVLLFACTEQVSSPSTSKKDELISPQINSTTTLVLNNGIKWEVSENMKPYITEAVDLIEDYTHHQDTNYLSLGKGLKEMNTLLIKNCTMKGQSHDELHKWLLPHMKLVDELSSAKTNEEANHVIHKLEESFLLFNTYFQ